MVRGIWLAVVECQIGLILLKLGDQAVEPRYHTLGRRETRPHHLHLRIQMLAREIRAVTHLHHPRILVGAVEAVLVVLAQMVLGLQVVVAELV